MLSRTEKTNHQLTDFEFILSKLKYKNERMRERERKKNYEKHIEFKEITVLMLIYIINQTFICKLTCTLNKYIL